MINLKESIESGEFYFIHVDDDCNDTISAQVKFDNFYQLDWSLVDEIDEVEDVEAGANIWILDISIVSLNKKKLSFDDLKDKFKLLDQDEYEYDVVEDSHLCGYSDFAEKTKLSKLHYVDLKPKILKSGAIAFELPPEFDELYVSIEEGEISEV
jgi:hypothetical protein